MTKEIPTDDSLRLESTPKFLDKNGAYKPFYIAQNAKTEQRGEVFLSDETNSTENADSGVTAATPAAVKAANDNANTRLSCVAANDQTVKSDVTFEKTIHSPNKAIDGNISGNAATATKLQTGRTITIKTKNNDATTTTGTFDGSTGITLNIDKIDARAVSEGTLPIDVIPRGALERLVKVQDKAARFGLTINGDGEHEGVQLGDSVLQIDTGVMYIVVNEKKLNSDDGYQEYKAGTALSASEAEYAKSAGSATTATTAGTATIAQKVANAVTFNILNGSINGKYTTDEVTFNGSAFSTVQIDNRVYNNFTAESSTAKGVSGLVPAPRKDEKNKFLCGDGTWKIAGEVTGVKGDAEANYRVGQVNITADNVGALPTTGGALTGNVTMTRDVGSYMGYILTASATGKSISFVIGSDKKTRGLYNNNTNKWMVYADANDDVFLNGKATSATNADSATTASKLNKTLSLTGPVTGNVSLSADGGQANLATTIGNGEIVTNMIHDGAVVTNKLGAGAVTAGKLGNQAVETSKVKDEAVTLAKLQKDIGTVYVGSSEPTDEHIKVWIQV